MVERQTKIIIIIIMLAVLMATFAVIDSRKEETIPTLKYSGMAISVDELLKHQVPFDKYQGKAIFYGNKEKMFMDLTIKTENQTYEFKDIEIVR